MGFDFIVIAPLLPSHCSFSFVFACGVSFLVSSSVFLSMIVQQLVVIPVFSKEGVRACPSTLPSWTNLRNSIFRYSPIALLSKSKKVSRSEEEIWFWGREHAPIAPCRWRTGLGTLAWSRSLPSWKQWAKGELRGETKDPELETSLIIKKAWRAEPQTTPEIVRRERKPLMGQNISWAGVPLKGTAFVARCESSSGLNRKRRISILVGSSCYLLDFLPFADMFWYPIEMNIILNKSNHLEWLLN